MTDEIRMNNDFKIRFGNAFHAMQAHASNCAPCRDYLNHGDGDLCSRGKDIIAMELAFAYTNIEFPA